MVKKNYKAIGSSILKDVLDIQVQGPDKDKTGQLHNAGNADLHKTGSMQNCNEDVRLHVYISSELEDRLLGEVYRRKRDKNISNGQASKRTVVEDALDAYLSPEQPM